MDEQTELAQAVQHKWMTRAEVAQLYRITPRGVDLLRADGRLTAYALGGPGRNRIVRFKRDEVEAALRPIDV